MRIELNLFNGQIIWMLFFVCMCHVLIWCLLVCVKTFLFFQIFSGYLCMSVRACACVCVLVYSENKCRFFSRFFSISFIFTSQNGAQSIIFYLFLLFTFGGPFELKLARAYAFVSFDFAFKIKFK